jgi:hypothetical protein
MFLTRRMALASALAAIPFAASAAHRRWPGEPAGGVDVSPLRRSGDNTDADFLEAALPGYLRQSFGAVPVRVRIDDVTYGVAGSSGGGLNNGAVDSIQGVGWAQGREAPLFVSLQTQVSFPDIGGYAARQRQDQLARAFAEWLPRQLGL